METDIMSYNRPPNVVIAGRALGQNPPATQTDPSGVLPVVLNVDVATTNSLGVIQVGSGLSITDDGVLSAVGGGGSCSSINVYLTSTNYTALSTDQYIGATTGGITITLPIGLVGKLYIVKNQAPSGSVFVVGSSGETLDESVSKTLGKNAVLLALFDGTRWNLI